MNGGTEFVLPTVHVRWRAIRGVLTRAALPAVAAALLLAGCGGGGSPAAASSSPASATSTAGLSAFQTCLKQHGVTVSPGQFAGRPTGSFSPRAFPSGSFSPGAFPSGSARPRPSFTGTQGAAFQACAKYAPAGFAGRGNGAISASALAAFKSCLASNGVKVTGTTARAILTELRGSTGKTAAALRTCQVLLQPAAPTSSPTSSS